MSHSFKTILKPARREVVERRSRFVADALPIESKEQALEALERVRREFPDATHHCYAYRIAPHGLEYRFADDGEPSGSAGKPILFTLQQNDLVNSMVVVTRYFGGTKLGVGGLARAYSEAARRAIDAARVGMQHPTDRLDVFATYDDVSAVRQLVERYALRFDEEFRDVVNYRMVIRSDQIEEFSDQINEVSQGRSGLMRLSDE